MSSLRQSFFVEEKAKVGNSAMSHIKTMFNRTLCAGLSWCVLMRSIQLHVSVRVVVRCKVLPLYQCACVEVWRFIDYGAGRQACGVISGEEERLKFGLWYLHSRNMS